MSLSKLLSGRKRGSVWWEFFLYDEGCNRSTCLVVMDETTKTACWTKVAGKKKSNSAAHLKRFHKQAHDSCMNKEKEKTCEKSQGVKLYISGAIKSQTLVDCLQRRIVSWPIESAEHQVRVKSVMIMEQKFSMLNLVLIVCLVSNL